jgi:hypothetical protein
MEPLVSAVMLDGTARLIAGGRVEVQKERSE